MISLAGRDIHHSWGKFVFTGFGLGLLIGVTLIMAGVYRGLVEDGRALLDSQVQNLVNAMAAFAVPTTTTLPPDYRAVLDPILAANWT